MHINVFFVSVFLTGDIPRHLTPSEVILFDYLVNVLQVKDDVTPLYGIKDWAKIQKVELFTGGII